MHAWIYIIILYTMITILADFNMRHAILYFNRREEEAKIVNQSAKLQFYIQKKLYVEYYIKCGSLSMHKISDGR